MRVLLFISQLFLSSIVIAQYSPQQIISTSINAPLSVYPVDIDGDGDEDILSGSAGKISWFDNLGNGTFLPHQVIDSNNFNVVSVYAQDIDGDGDMDVFSASDANSSSNDPIAWYENLGGGVFGPQQIIDPNMNVAFFVYVEDIDGDGDFDVISASSDGPIRWYENMGSNTFSPPQDIYSWTGLWRLGIYLRDIDNDGDLDILSETSALTSDVNWFENLGNGVFGIEQTIITGSMSNNLGIYPIDMDGDGDIDLIESTQGSQIGWRENLGNMNFGNWQSIAINGTVGHSVFADDVDGDGDVDVFSAYINSPAVGLISWYRNLGNNVFSPTQIITTDINFYKMMHTSDLDLDGDQDLISVSAGDDKVAWYEYDSSFTDSVFLEISSFNRTLTARVTPNPFSDYTEIILDNPLNTDYGLSIYNILGEEVKRVNKIAGNKIRINKTDIGRGLFLAYLTNLNTGGRIFIEKLVTH